MKKLLFENCRSNASNRAGGVAWGFGYPPFYPLPRTKEFNIQKGKSQSNHYETSPFRSTVVLQWFLDISWFSVLYIKLFCINLWPDSWFISLDFNEDSIGMLFVNTLHRSIFLMGYMHLYIEPTWRKYI